MKTNGHWSCAVAIIYICLTLQVVIQHLKEQLAQSLVENKHISILQSSKLSLEGEVKQLQQDLQEARSSHTPVSCLEMLI